jgi:eukaryotic-like serine/threonine-protein kinase
MPATDAMAHLNSALAGRYEIERELGAGGMATVYLAHDLKHKRQVALKVLRADVAQTVGAERFLREIHLAAKLSHPHILPLFDSGEAGGFVYYAMPNVEGFSLRDRLNRESKLPVAEAVRVTQEIADALDYAHRHGVIHRDVKPENIMLQDGHALVADFGIGKAVDDVAVDTLTQHGVSVGTPAYMSPEQAAGESLDGRSDLYSLGCVLYEMLTGEQPFTGSTVQAVIAKRFVQTPADVTALREGVPRAVARAVRRALARSPIDRFETGASFLAALREPDAPADAKPPAPEKSIAVLPFANMSAEPDNEFFSDGITDDIIGALTQVPGLKVAARTSSFAFKGKNEELATVGRRLGVRTVLQGSVRRAGNRVRVTAQLMDTRDGFQLWSERFDRDLDDIFAIQDEITRSIVERLELTLGLKAATPLVVRQTDDLEAYQLYLRGREAVQQRTPVSMRHGLDFFVQALARDPGYARAHLGVAEAYIGLGVWQNMPPAEARAKAERALAEAVRLQPDLPSVHVLRAQLKLYLRPDWRSAGDDLAEALRRDPHDALANVYLAYLRGLLRDRAARSSAADRAVRADPLSPFVRGIAGMSFSSTGDYEQALALYDEGLGLDPNSMLNNWLSGVALQRMGRHAEATARFVRAVELSQRSPAQVAGLQRHLAIAGRADDARALRNELEARARTEYVGPVIALIMDIAAQDEERIAEVLRLNVEAGTGPPSAAILMDVELEAMLTHPRLGPLVQQLSLYAERPVLLPVAGGSATGLP